VIELSPEDDLDEVEEERENLDEPLATGKIEDETV
jgi:hypothetical protein